MKLMQELQKDYLGFIMAIIENDYIVTITELQNVKRNHSKLGKSSLGVWCSLQELIKNAYIS